MILSIIAASVVDLPEPVGPVTSTRPRGFYKCERNEETFLDSRGYRQEIGIPPFEVPEQQGSVTVKHVATRTELARRAAADVGLPDAGDSRPVKLFPAVVLCQQTDSCGVCGEDLQNRVQASV